MKKIDLTRKRFGSLIAVSSVKVGRDSGWICLCDCGSSVSVVTGSLTAGKTKSCGCLRKNVSRKKATTHGLTGHPLHSVYKNMLRRCYSPTATEYKNYGGRGIEVCNEWIGNPVSFFNFSLRSGWELGLTIDRIDNDGNYEPKNCRFVTRSENNRNRSGIQSNNTTGFRGVSYSKRNRKYVAYIKNRHIGYFKTAEEAYKARTRVSEGK